VTASAPKRIFQPAFGFFRYLKPAVAVAVLVFGLGACSTYEYLSDKISDPIVLKCPNYWVVADAANVVKFRDGPGRDLTDVNYEGKIVGVRLGCVSSIDKKTRAGTMEVDVTVRFNAQRGPANRDRKASFDYFIRVLDPNGNILKGENLSVFINFPGNKTRLQFQSPPLTFEFPITSQWPNTYYRIFAGFKLTRDELDSNRRRARNANP
jgi:hypothetical protein